jgi:hypothetical protein
VPCGAGALVEWKSGRLPVLASLCRGPTKHSNLVSVWLVWVQLTVKVWWLYLSRPVNQRLRRLWIVTSGRLKEVAVTRLPVEGFPSILVRFGY